MDGLSCPRCKSENVRCQHRPHMHLCLDCGYDGTDSAPVDGKVTDLMAALEAVEAAKEARRKRRAELERDATVVNAGRSGFDRYDGPDLDGAA